MMGSRVMWKRPKAVMRYLLKCVKMRLLVVGVCLTVFMLWVRDSPPQQRPTVKDILFGGQEEVKPKRRVLLWTQQRSGSSLVKDLLTAPTCSFISE